MRTSFANAVQPGLPATLRAGKSLTVHEALRRTWRAERGAGRPAPHLVSINCMTLTQPAEVYARIAAGLAAPPAGADEPILYPGAAAHPLWFRGLGYWRIAAGLAASPAGADEPIVYPGTARPALTL